MDIIKEDIFRKQIKSGLSGGYLFFGEEDYMKSFDISAARKSICDDETFAFFNDMRRDALDYTPDALLDAITALPMMSDKKIVTLTGLDMNSMKPREIDELCEILGTLGDYDYNVLIISVPAGLFDEGTLPKRPSALLKRLSNYLTPVLFDQISGSRLVSWIAKHFEHHGVVASPEVCSALVEYSGKSMYNLSFETEKIAYYVLYNGRNTVYKEDIEKVACAELSVDAYALSNAILDGRNDEALAALGVMKFKRVEPLILLSEVSRTICDMAIIKSLLDKGSSASEIASALKMNEYKAKIYVSGVMQKSAKRISRAISLCSEADMSMKSSAGGYSAIEKLICSL